MFWFNVLGGSWNRDLTLFLDLKKNYISKQISASSRSHIIFFDTYHRIILFLWRPWRAISCIEDVCSKLYLLRYWCSFFQPSESQQIISVRPGWDDTIDDFVDDFVGSVPLSTPTPAPTDTPELEIQDDDPPSDNLVKTAKKASGTRRVRRKQWW